MNVTYHGLSCIKITTTSSQGTEVVIVTDPFNYKPLNVKPARFKGNIVISSLPSSPLHGHTDAVTSLEEQLFIVSEPGEYEIKEVSIYGMMDAQMHSIIYRIECEQMVIAFLGALKSTEGIKEQQLTLLQDVDIVMVPIGGNTTTDLSQAHTIITQLEPRLVVPIHYSTAGIHLKDLSGTPEQFIKELGINKLVEPTTKLKLALKDLPQDETQVSYLVLP